MSKALIAVVGPSGSGKSSSLRNMEPKETLILDGERKGFPFRNYQRFTIRTFGSPAEFTKQFQAAMQEPQWNYIVIESFTKYAEQVLTSCQKTYTGWDVFGNYAKMIRNTLNSCKNDHKVVIWTAIDDIVQIQQTDGTEASRRRIYVNGKELAGKIEYEFLIVLFCSPRKNKDGKIEYYFQTNTDGITSAKTPMAMFDELYVENDLAMVIRKAQEYYLPTPTPTPTPTPELTETPKE